MSDRVGFHFEGQYLEAEVSDGMVTAVFVDDTELEPSLDLIRHASTAVRRGILVARGRAGQAEELQR